MGNLMRIFFWEKFGAEEELQGFAFRGPAGELLNKIIEAMGFNERKCLCREYSELRPT